MKTLRFLRSLSRSVSVVLPVVRGAAVVGLFSSPRRICACGIATALLLGTVNAHAAIPPLPPLPEPFPETLPTDQFAVEVPAAVIAKGSDEDAAWLTPTTTSATPAPVATLDATPALEGPPTPLPPVERMSRGAADSAATSLDDGKPISLNLKNADLSAVLQTFAKFSGVNIVASDKIRGLVSLNLVDVPWRRAFDTLLDVHGLEWSATAKSSGLPRLVNWLRESAFAMKRTPVQPISSRSPAARSFCAIRVPTTFASS